ncbi:MAG: DUF2066 domain-containing protein [Alphaproteobacteria bacterium]
MVHRPARMLWAGIIFVFASLAVAMAPARAQTAGRGGVFDPFTVSGVAVDKTAQSAAAARADAIAEGQRLALQRLIKRLAAKPAADRISITAARAAELVRDFDIAEEKSSGVRYIAKLNVRFKPDAVRAMLRAEGAPFAETASRPLVVVPVYEGGGAPILWDDANPWREAWSAKLPRDGLVPMILPMGDLADIAAVKAEQARDGDSVKLRALAAKYNAGGTLVAVARLDSSGELQVTSTRLGTTGAPQTVVERFKPSPGESREALLQRAADSVATQIEERWKQDNLLRFGGGEQALETDVPFGSLREWVEIRNRLGRVAQIRRSDVRAISRRDAHVILHYVGDETQLSQALAQLDLRLETQGEGRTLRLAAPLPAPPPAPQ